MSVPRDILTNNLVLCLSPPGYLLIKVPHMIAAMVRGGVIIFMACICYGQINVPPPCNRAGPP